MWCPTVEMLAIAFSYPLTFQFFALYMYCCVTDLQEDDSKEALTDGDPDTYWESDGSQSRHWIRLHMKTGTVIRYCTGDVLCTDTWTLLKPRKIVFFCLFSIPEICIRPQITYSKPGILQ